MPYQPFNYANIEPQGNPAVRDLADSLSKGFNAGFSPFEKKESLLADILKNKLTEEYGAKEKEADINYKNALAANASNPFTHLTGLPAEYYGAEILSKQLGEKHPIVQQVKQGLQNKIAQQQSLMNYRENLIQTRNFSSLPAAEKQRTLAIIAGAGINPTDGLKMLNAGASLENVLATEGRTVEDVVPNYPLANAAVTQLQQREGFAEEIKTLENRLSEAVPEGRLIGGYSIPDTLKALRNKDPDQVGKTLAWRAMQPELAALRLKAMGGNVGIEAIREMKEAALGDLKIVESFISKEAKQAMNKHISQWVDEAAGIYNKTLTKGSRLGKSANAARDAKVAADVAEIIKNNPGMVGTSSGNNNDPLGLR